MTICIIVIMHNYISFHVSKKKVVMGPSFRVAVLRQHCRRWIVVAPPFPCMQKDHIWVPRKGVGSHGSFMMDVLVCGIVFYFSMLSTLAAPYIIEFSTVRWNVV